MHRLLVLAACTALAAGSGFAAGKADAAKGKEAFQKQCAVCHNADSDQKKVGPGLKALFKKDKMANGKKPTEGNVLSKIEDGGNGMPAYKDMLSTAEKDDVVAYLKTL